MSGSNLLHYTHAPMKHNEGVPKIEETPNPELIQNAYTSENPPLSTENMHF